MSFQIVFLNRNSKKQKTKTKTKTKQNKTKKKWTKKKKKSTEKIEPVLFQKALEHIIGRKNQLKFESTELDFKVCHLLL